MGSINITHTHKCRERIHVQSLNPCVLHRRFKQDEQVYINFNLFHGMKGLSKILFRMTFFQIFNIINFVFRIKNDSFYQHRNNYDYCEIYIKYIAKLDGIYQYNT
jgi:hypothetical protein